MSGPANPLSEASAVKLALMARQVRAQAAETLLADPIAIIGMACRLPGGADTPDRFWTLLRNGVSTAREVPPDRWNGNAWYDPDLSTTGKTVTKSGSFLDRIDEFDAGYFGIPPREAERMDPQQRLFLEVAIEALDDAGLTQPELAGSRTGVFVASYHNDYAQLQYNDHEAIDLRTLTGTLHSVLANRLSHFLDLRGPSISIDSACSASLVAIHLACQSLRLGESGLAIAGGVSLMITPELLVAMSKIGFMAPDGRCKTFDEKADGFGRGEGCALVVLKRLSDAIADADGILAVIRGSAVNQDGHSTVLAAPSGPAQEAVIREALACAQMRPERIGLMETHGTGTALGDPIEVEAIAATLGRPSPGSGPLLLGSVKANLGHLEAAAGATSLLKTVLALRHEGVPAQVNYTRLNPHISLAGTRLSVPTDFVPWPVGTVPRCAAVSSFGVGGTNAHVVIEEAPRLPATTGKMRPDTCFLLPLSAKTPAALRDLVRSWADFLADTPETVADLCYTASRRRTHYGNRMAVAGRSKAELRERLQAWLSQTVTPPASPGRATVSRSGIGFVFGGQGPQWHAMGRELLAEEPVFRAAMTECDALVRPWSGWSLLDELALPAERSRLDQTEIAQPALFALQVALAALWRSWGVSPDAVVGHSVGEIAALHVAGVLSLEEAVRIVWHRGRIMQQATGLGRMAAVSLSEADARVLVAPYGERLSIAAVNGPASVVLSGQPAALDAALAMLTARGIDHRSLPVRYAFHSAQMAPFQRSLIDQLGPVRTAAPEIPVYSTVTGGRADDTSFDAGYFGRNVREPVQFARAIGAMNAAGCDLFIELSPHPVLAHSIVECLAPHGPEPTVLASLRRGRPERPTMLQACGGVYAAGGDLNWTAVQPATGSVVTLPGYPWQRRRHWLRPRPVRETAAATADAWHPLVGRQIAVAGSEIKIFEGESEKAADWLVDRLLLPAAALIEMLLAAVSKAMAWPQAQLTDFTVQRPLVLPEPDAGHARWQVVVKPLADGRAELTLYQAAPKGTDPKGADPSGAGRDWLLIASAIGGPAHDETIAAWSAPTPDSVAAQTIYDGFDAGGVAFGSAFRCLGETKLGDGAAEAWISLPSALQDDTVYYTAHPVLIDAAFQLCWLAATRGRSGQAASAMYLPIGADRIDLRPGRHDRLLASVRIIGADTGSTVTADILLETARGERVGTIHHMRFARAEPAMLAAADHGRGDLYTVGWVPAPELRAPQPIRSGSVWAVFADDGGIAQTVAARITGAGGRCYLILAGTAYAQLSDIRWQIDPTNPGHYRQLFADIGLDGATLRGGVIHCWALDESAGVRADQAGMEADDARGVGSVLHLVQCLATVSAEAACPTWLITRGAQAVTGSEQASVLRPASAGVWGLAGVAAIEHPELHLRVIDLDPLDKGTSADDLLNELLDRTDPRVALRGQGRWVPRLQHHGRVPQGRVEADDQASRVELVRPGIFEGLELKPLERVALQPDEVRLRVMAAGINFRDVLTVLQMYPGASPPLGVECAGIVTEAGRAVTTLQVGDRVFGFAPASLATEAVVPAAFLMPVPERMRTDDAAGIAVAYLTAHYGLHQLAQLRAGERVLVHAAAGGVGLAAVQLAQRCGAEVFATAGSPGKRDLLHAMGVTHVMDSRSVAFADQVMAATGGQGVDVVLNSLAGHFIPAGLRALARGGRFLELGKRGIWSAEAVAEVRPDIGYYPYDLGALAQSGHVTLRPMYDAILAALADGSLHPLPVTVFPLGQVAEALRYMAQARHVGKVVVRIADDDAHGSAFQAHATATYWITGGLGALGLETAHWLTRAGARHLVLSGRRPPTETARQKIREIEQHGVTVRVFEADAADRGRTQFILDQIASTMPPLRGVVHAAGLIRDAMLINQRWSDAQGVLRSKAHGAWLLHEATRALPLDFFILYSAAGVVLGAPGQGLYPAANAQLDALAHFRRRSGLPALSVAWGAWSAGMAADLAERGQDVWQARGLGKINATDGFAQLERLLTDGMTYGAVIPVDWRRFLERLPADADRSFFSDVAPAGPKPISHPAPHNDAAMLERLRTLPPAQRHLALSTYLTDQVRNLLGLDSATPIEAGIPLKELGLDSLMSVELRNILVRSAGAPLPATLLFDHPTLGALAACLGRTWRLDDGRTAPAATTQRDTGAIADLSEAEAEALLAEELALEMIGTPA